MLFYKTVLKFTLKPLRHVLVQPQHHRINYTPMYFNGLF